MTDQRQPLPTRVEQTPDLPPEYEAALAPALDALGVVLTPDARARIDGHVRLLLAWTTAINLTAIRAPAAVALAHVADSLAAVALLRERGAGRFIDLGSGGGLPGIPIAAALPARAALLVEPISKKAAFLETVVAATAMAGSVRVAAIRSEALASDPAHRAAWPAVTARAVATLADLVELALPLLEPGGVLVAWKRGDLGDELSAASRAGRELGGAEIRSVPVKVDGLAGHVLIEVRRTGRVPAGFPRDPAVRKRRPW